MSMPPRPSLALSIIAFACLAACGAESDDASAIEAGASMAAKPASAAAPASAAIVASASASPATDQRSGKESVSPATWSELQKAAEQGCMSGATIPDEAFARGDLDGDGKQDLVVHMRKVACAQNPSVQGNGFCGSRGCSVDVYLSSIHKPGAYAQGFTNPSDAMPAFIRDAKGLGLRYAGAGDPIIWRWTGKRMEADRSRHNAAGDLATILVGSWIGPPDACDSDGQVHFEKNGSYRDSESEGAWKLIGNQLTVTTHSVAPMDNMPPQPVPQPFTWTLAPESRDAIEATSSDGQSFRLERCS